MQLTIKYIGRWLFFCQYDTVQRQGILLFPFIAILQMFMIKSTVIFQFTLSWFWQNFFTIWTLNDIIYLCMPFSTQQLLLWTGFETPIFATFETDFSWTKAFDSCHISLNVIHTRVQWSSVVFIAHYNDRVADNFESGLLQYKMPLPPKLILNSNSAKYRLVISYFAVA